MDLHGRTIVIRVDEATLDAEGATFFSDLIFLGNLGMRPMVVAPTTGAARAVVRSMNRSGDAAVGLSGADAGMIPAASGAIAAVQTKLLHTLLAAGYVPVIEPLAFGFAGDDVVVAADDVALGRQTDRGHLARHGRSSSTTTAASSTRRRRCSSIR